MVSTRGERRRVGGAALSVLRGIEIDEFVSERAGVVGRGVEEGRSFGVDAPRGLTNLVTNEKIGPKRLNTPFTIPTKKENALTKNSPTFLYHGLASVVVGSLVGSGERISLTGLGWRTGLNSRGGVTSGGLTGVCVGRASRKVVGLTVWGS